MFYKYCHRQHVDLLLNGIFRFSSLAYFRHIETSHGDAHTGDALEGRTEVVLEEMDLAGPPSDEQRAILARSPIYIEPGANVIGSIRDVRTVRDCGHWLVFCFTSAEQYEGYDARVEITNPHALRDVIWNSGSVGGLPVEQLFDLCVCKEVSYDRRTVSARELNEDPEPSPFVKRERYGHQRETRIALRAKNPDLRDIVDINVVVPEGLLASTASTGEAIQVPPLRSAGDLALAMIEVVSRYHDGQRELQSLLPQWRSGGGWDRAQHERMSNDADSQFWSHYALRELMDLYWEVRAHHGIRAECDQFLGQRTENPLNFVRAFAEMADKLDPKCLSDDLLWYVSPLRRSARLQKF